MQIIDDPIKSSMVDAIETMKAKGATEEEISRMWQYQQAKRALEVTRKTLGIPELITKYFSIERRQ